MNRALGAAGVIGSAIWLRQYTVGAPLFGLPGTPNFDAYVAFGRLTPLLIALIGLGFFAALAPLRGKVGRFAAAGTASILAGFALMVTSRVIQYWVLPPPTAALIQSAWDTLTISDGLGTLLMMAGSLVVGISIWRNELAEKWFALLFILLPGLTLLGAPTGGESLPLGVIGIVIGGIAAIRAARSV